MGAVLREVPKIKPLHAKRQQKYTSLPCSQRELCVCLCVGGYVYVCVWGGEAYNIQYMDMQ